MLDFIPAQVCDPWRRLQPIPALPGAATGTLSCSCSHPTSAATSASLIPAKLGRAEAEPHGPGRNWNPAFPRARVAQTHLGLPQELLPARKSPLALPTRTQGEGKTRLGLSAELQLLISPRKNTTVFSSQHQGCSFHTSTLGTLLKPKTSQKLPSVPNSPPAQPSHLPRTAARLYTRKLRHRTAFLAAHTPHPSSKIPGKARLLFLFRALSRVLLLHCKPQGAEEQQRRGGWCKVTFLKHILGRKRRNPTWLKPPELQG